MARKYRFSSNLLNENGMGYYKIILVKDYGIETEFIGLKVYSDGSIKEYSDGVYEDYLASYSNRY